MAALALSLLVASLGTDSTASAQVADSDGDGLIDSGELLLGIDPLEADSDGDGLGDGVEMGLLDPRNPDTDGDGLLDGDEVFAFGTLPFYRDTDSDGLPDGVEVT